MPRKTLAVLSTLLIVVGLVMMSISPAIATPAASGNDGVPKSDNRPDPLTTKQLDLKQKALEAKLNGKAYGKTHEVARGQYVELAREGEGVLWTVLGEFSDLPHNSIPQPDPSVNNRTIWVPDFNRDYYINMLFNDSPGANSMRNFYIEQSSNRYTVHGDVTDWVPVGNHLIYDDNPDSNVWFFLEDIVNGWYDAQIAAGKTPAQINEHLSQFDVWDRYDYDFDGNFDEPDGYIDTFQAVHSGEGEEDGGGVLGAEAIWSHSWYARYQLIGKAGPPFNMLGGIQVGQSGYWVGKYTIQPENGSVGVFSHEYGHDMGLPDLYDYYGENGTGFWTLMSSGSNTGYPNTIRSHPTHMGAWEKFQLGWLNYEVARAGQKSEHKLGPMEYNTKQAQGLFVILPQKPVTVHIADPYAGSYFYFSGDANNLRNQMTKAFTLGAGATLAAKVNYGIEVDYDYANVIVSTDGGATWQTVPTNLSNSTVEPNGIDGVSGGWVDLTANLPEGNVLVGFKYTTDAGVNWGGFMVDELFISGYPLDGAETDTGWTYTPAGGFRRTTGIEAKLYSQYYVAEYRTYKGYDLGLKLGPYYFGYAEKPQYADRFAYQDGLLINFWDTSQKDNNTGLHPGQGLLLTIDAHPQALKRCGGPAIWRNRVQSYDSTFTLDPTDGVPNIHHNSVSCPVPSLPAVPVFDDRYSHYDPANPLGSVITPNTGTIIEIRSISALDGFMQVQVRPAK